MKVLTRDEACYILKKKILEGFTVVCIGSELRSDDRAAIELCKELESSKLIKTLICEYGIENCIGEILEDGIKKIVLIDAAIASGLDPASIIILNINEVQNYMPYSTHALPLPLLLKLIMEELKDVEIVIMGIVVSKLDIGLEMNPQIKNLISSLINCLFEENVLN